jgi:Rod binding domain-containing protein
MKTPHIKPPTSFDTASLLARGRFVAAHGGGPDQHDQLVKQTEKWVSQTFYGTLLKQMRDSPFHSDLMDGGNGGKAFATMFDQRLADHMSRHAGGKLVKSIVKKIESAHAAKRYASASRTKSAHPQHHGTASHSPSSLNPEPRTLNPLANPEPRTPNPALDPEHRPRSPHPRPLRKVHVRMAKETA